MKKIIVSVTNDLTTDQRVHKICNTLSELNFEVLLIGRKLNNSLPIKRFYKTKRMSLLFNKGFLFYTEYNLRLFFLLLFERKNILLSNDVDTIIPNYLIGKIFNIPVILDSHELFSEVPELVNRPFVKSIWKKIERYFIPKIEYKYTVSNSIANYYLQNLNTSFEVIRNVPKRINENYNATTKIQLNKNAILYQGALNKGRGLELMITTMQYIDNITFYIVGEGDISDRLKQDVTNKNLSKKVVFLGKILPNELFDITKQAAIGISSEEDLGLNYRYALPNKLFDYIQAKVPVLVSDLPEMKQLVNQYKIGKIISERTPEKLAKEIEQLIENRQSFQKNLEMAANELCWENEELKLIKIFEQVV